MAKIESWDTVIQKPEYQQLPEEEKVVAKRQYEEQSILADFKSAYESFKKDYPDLYDYGKKVATGGFLKENIQKFDQALANARGQAFDNKPDTGEGNILDYFAPAAMTAFHGSPHKFNKFSLSKVGTGEGAQMYGHGLYFAENPKVAGSYVEDFVNKKDNLAGEISLLEQLQRSPGTGAEKYKEISGKLKEMRKAYSSMERSLYEVDIPDEQINKFLDWDAPINKQPKDVLKILKENEEQIMEKARTVFPKNGIEQYADINALYSGLTRELGGQAQATNYLNSLGIKGVKYLDQGSRNLTGGKATKNLVVFDDEIVKVLKRTKAE